MGAVFSCILEYRVEIMDIVVGIFHRKWYSERIERLVVDYQIENDIGLVSYQVRFFRYIHRGYSILAIALYACFERERTDGDSPFFG